MKRLIKLTSTALALLTVFTLSTGLQAEDAKLPDLNGRTIVAVTENNYLPLNFVDPKSGDSVGWEYDAMAMIAEKLNAKLEWQVTAWEGMIESVRQGAYDIGMDGITINEERAKQVDFSAPYMTSEQFMLVRADDDRFTDAKSFAANDKLLIGAQPGTTNFYVAVYNVLDGDEKNARIKLFDSFGAIVQALKQGDIDMVLMDRTSANGYIGASAGSFKTVGEALGSEEFGFILPKGSDLVEPVNAAITALKADGSFEKLNQKWFFEYNQQ